VDEKRSFGDAVDERREAVAPADDKRDFEDTAGERRGSNAPAGEARDMVLQRAPVDAAARGTALHKALEKLDYRAARMHTGDASWFDSYLDGLADAGFLTAEQRTSVGAGDLIRFAGSDVCARAASALLPLSPAGQESGRNGSPHLRKETPFNYRMELDGERIIVQGIIDLFFEEDGELVLVDFKSGGGAYKDSAARAKHALHTYGEQIRLYREALEAITGKRVKEALLYLTSLGETISVPESPGEIISVPEASGETTFAPESSVSESPEESVSASESAGETVPVPASSASESARETVSAPSSSGGGPV
jgi:ATP-dependent exoDNAse (exonuclease V) beta subunit